MNTTAPVTYNCSDPDFLNTTQCQNELQVAADQAFGVSFLINFALFLLFMVLFYICKRVASFRSVYVPRKDVSPPSEGIFGWIASPWGMTEKELVLKRGMDMAVYLLFLKYCFWMTVGLMPYGLILIVTHATSGGLNVGIAMIGLGNVPEGSSFLIADLVGVFWNTAVVLVSMYWMYVRYVELRLFSVQRSSSPENFTVLVREVGLASDAEVFETFDTLFPGKVASVSRAYNVRALDRMHDLREKLVHKIEKADATFWKKGKKPLTCTRPDRLWCCPPRLDEQDFFTHRLAAQDETVATEIAYLEPNKRLASAFVVFKDARTTQMALQCNIRTKKACWPLETSWKLEAPPTPSAIRWRGLRVGPLELLIRRLLVAIGTILLVFFWSIPVVFASGLANISTLLLLLPFLEPLLAVPFIKSFVEGFLPGLVLLIFFALLVSVLITIFLVGAEGHWHSGRARSSVTTKYYFFLVVNVFFVYALVGGVIELLPQLIEDPLSIVNILATTLPAQVQQFLSYVMIASFSQFSIELWRPSDILVHWLRTKFWCCAKTKRNRREISHAYDDSYHEHMARHLLLTLILLTYSTLNPLMIAFGAVYYGLAYITALYNIVYVFTHGDENNGVHFPLLFARVMVSLLIYQICLAGVLGLKLFPAAVAVIACLVITCLFWYYTNLQLRRLGENGVLLTEASLLHAGSIDSKLASKAYPSKDTYVCHLLKPSKYSQVENQDPEVEVIVQAKGQITWTDTNGGVEVHRMSPMQEYFEDSAGAFDFDL